MNHETFSNCKSNKNYAKLIALPTRSSESRMQVKMFQSETFLDCTLCCSQFSEREVSADRDFISRVYAVRLKFTYESIL